MCPHPASQGPQIVLFEERGERLIIFCTGGALALTQSIFICVVYSVFSFKFFLHVPIFSRFSFGTPTPYFPISTSNPPHNTLFPPLTSPHLSLGGRGLWRGVKYSVYGAIEHLSLTLLPIVKNMCYYKRVRSQI
jgi:hypothetical protein